jgi:mycothiol synthase
MMQSLTIEPAHPEEWIEALRLAFQHLPAAYQHARTTTAVELVRNKEIDPAGILVARAGGRLIGSMICMTIPGASGLLWPPQVERTAPEPSGIEDRLIEHAVTWLRRRGAKLGQTMLIPEEAFLAVTLIRNGFRHITTLCYMRIEPHSQVPVEKSRLIYQSYRTDPELFHQTLLQTYEATQDCPELTGVRTIEEIMEGHRAQGEHDPAYWWLTLLHDRPVGVLLLTRMPEWNSWDVAYVGVTVPARRQGLGRAIMHRAIAEAQRQQAPYLTLSVDKRNEAAWQMYQQLGFEVFDRREVFLALWHR